MEESFGKQAGEWTKKAENKKTDRRRKREHDRKEEPLKPSQPRRVKSRH